MNAAERFLRTEQIFSEIVSMEELERSQALESYCGGDTTLLAELRALLQACEAEELHRGLLHSDASTQPRLTGRVGNYAIDRLLGRGGMGAVYLAHRVDGQFEQQVAVKLIDLPLATEFFRDRFRVERQILAGLSHPYIAKLLDGGVSEHGDLYLAMEYIDGVPITDFCESRHSSIHERVTLFLKVSEAVQYAHQNLVVHRDLKPDNILVMADGSPRLLDFGTAKILAPFTEPSGSDITRSGLQTFTPRYASPEQILGRSITVASDVYSLGVLLYLLLTGSMPYDLTEFTTEEMVRVICHEQPPKPSSVAPRTLKLDPDLDAIVLKALRKDPAERYTTAEQLSTDLQAYLDQRPVQARRGNFQYVTGKFVRRNKFALVGVSVLIIALLTGMFAFLWQSRLANRQRLRAEARSTELRELSTSLLAEIDSAVKDLPGSTPVQFLLVKRVLEDLDHLAKEAGNDPVLALDMMNAYTQLGNLQGNPYHQNIGDTKGALQSLDKALSFAPRPFDATILDPKTLRSYGFAEQSRSEVLYALGRDAESAAALKKGIRAFDALAAHVDATAADLAFVGSSYNALGDQRNRLGDDDPKDPESSVSAYRHDLTIIDRILRLDSVNKSARRGLALIHAKIAASIEDVDPDGAVEEARRSIAAWEALPADLKSLRSNRQGEAFALRVLGGAIADVGEYEAAVDVYSQALEIDESYAKADPKDASAVYWVAYDLQNQAAIEARMLDRNLYPSAKNDALHRRLAIELLRRALRLDDDLLALSPANPAWITDQAANQIGLATLEQGTPRANEAERVARTALKMLRSAADKPDVPLPTLVSAVVASLSVLPVNLRDPAWTLRAAQRLNDRTRGKTPSYLLAFAQAYRTTGDTAHAAETAKVGLALLAPTKPRVNEPRVQRLLQIEAKGTW
jgi:serine/threonine protein kinase